MWHFKDRDPFVYNDSLYTKKKKREDRIKRIISALLACNILVCGIVISLDVKYKFDHDNPFDGQSISSSDFSTNYKAMKARSITEDENLKEAIEYIKNSDIDEKKAYLLYYALIANEDLTKEEKKNLSGYIQYFLDNKYLDYERIYRKFSSFLILPDDPDLFGDENLIGGVYKHRDNTLTFTSQEGRNFALGHETGHAEDNLLETEHNLLETEHYDFTWLIEGLTALLDYEYKDGPTETYDIEVTFCRILCEFIDPDVLLETRAKGDINILINALLDKGLSSTDVNHLFYSFGKINHARKAEYLDEEKATTIGLLKRIYRKINKSSSKINPTFYEYISYIANGCYAYYPPNKYYFNSKNINENGVTIVASSVEFVTDPNTSHSVNEGMKYEKRIEYHQDCIVEKVIKDGVIERNVITYIEQESIDEIIAGLEERSKTK